MVHVVYIFNMVRIFIVVYAGLPTIFHIFAHTVPVEERSRAFGYLVALGSVGQTVTAIVSSIVYLYATPLHVFEAAA